MKLNSFTNGIFNKIFDSNKVINPKRDWILLIILFLVMLVCAITYDSLIYTKISNGEMYVSINRNELNLENLKIDELKKLIDNFESKSAKISSLKIGPSIDPSL